MLSSPPASRHAKSVATKATTFLAHSNPRNPSNPLMAYGKGTRNEWVGGKPEKAQEPPKVATKVHPLKVSHKLVTRRLTKSVVPTEKMHPEAT